MLKKCGKCSSKLSHQEMKPYKDEDSLPDPLPMERLPRGPIQCDNCVKKYQEERERQIHTINKVHGSSNK